MLKYYIHLINVECCFQEESENLHKELDHYQHELATLHTTYSQRIATLNKKHKQEMDVLECVHHEDLRRIEVLEQQLTELGIIT